MPTSIRSTCALGAIVLASLLSGPASAGKPGLILVLDTARPDQCKTALDGSLICNEGAGGPGSIGGPNPNSPYNECKMGCGEHALTLAVSKRDAYLQKCLTGCRTRYGQKVKGGG
jgi:hypothetical protein